ncbi:unnamed protein product [Arctogadus glacialis]
MEVEVVVISIGCLPFRLFIFLSLLLSPFPGMLSVVSWPQIKSLTNRLCAGSDLPTYYFVFTVPLVGFAKYPGLSGAKAWIAALATSADTRRMYLCLQSKCPIFVLYSVDLQC